MGIHPLALDLRPDGLEWEAGPSAELLTWEEACATALAAGWRLPSTGELVGLLGDLRIEAAWTPPAGTTLWSASGSPFAPTSHVRAVCCELDGGITVVLLDKAARAQRWAVRRRR
jgi:hypothetical protein